MLKFKKWEVEVEVEAVQAPASTKILHQGVLVDSVPEPTQTVRLHVRAPDGKEKTFSVTLYTLCHGENPRLELGEPSLWAQDEPDGENAIGVWFPDGTLNIFPDFKTLWED